MNTTTEKLDCAADVASLGQCVLRETLALANGIKLATENHLDETAQTLADLAVQHAERWAQYFDEQVALHEARDNEKKGAEA